MSPTTDIPKCGRRTLLVLFPQHYDYTSSLSIRMITSKPFRGVPRFCPPQAIERLNSNPAPPPLKSLVKMSIHENHHTTKIIWSSDGFRRLRFSKARVNTLQPFSRSEHLAGSSILRWEAARAALEGSAYQAAHSLPKDDRVWSIDISRKERGF